MESDRPTMDRLVCGDVGWKKRKWLSGSFFAAVADNKQVAVLVPTTVLCFLSAFPDLPRTFEVIALPGGISEPCTYGRTGKSGAERIEGR